MVLLQNYKDPGASPIVSSRKPVTISVKAMRLVQEAMERSALIFLCMFRPMQTLNKNTNSFKQFYVYFEIEINEKP